MQPFSTYARQPRLLAALAALAFAGSLVYAAQAARRIRLARENLASIAAQRNALKPLQHRWARYRRTEATLPREGHPAVPATSPELPTPDAAETNRVALTPAWVHFEWRGEWLNLDYTALPGYLTRLADAQPPWRVRELHIEPAGTDPARGRFLILAETLTPGGTESGLPADQ